MVECLRPGDLVVTRDNGVKPILWIGRKTLGHMALRGSPHLKPILLQRGYFGLDEKLVVSPQHGVLLRQAVGGGEDVLFRAVHLARMEGGAARVMHGCRRVTYIHLLLDGHEIIFANGIPSESLFLGEEAVKSLGHGATSKIATLFRSHPRQPCGERFGTPIAAYSRTKHLPDDLRALQVAQA